ncbi:hypothetical protein H6G89_27850 [Oscillatoria sp. FACHB-1407]|uniref:hypothetical protein n=1 Tax=Oscillatoria sp. FACHB-1407 TaxID=2692847 RepID=UPI0016869FC3|nr:hypothetical protein [Oscillatoria sp. FACHB-1407]MBD2464820.1 hypothetical protein [Oscillatoria sp. FACHB-1407]
MRPYLILGAIAGLWSAINLSPIPSHAGLPDAETYDFVMSRYNLPIQDDTDCRYYANPKTLTINGDERRIIVLFTQGDVNSVMCNGVFEFQVLIVNCRLGEVTYSPQLDSPANWVLQEQRSIDYTVANQICSLSSR